MGFEFTAKFEKEAPLSTLNVVIKAISADPNYKTVKLDDQKLRLQYVDPNERCTWPEDIVLDMNKHGVYILFHLDRRDAINRFVKLVESTCAAHNIPCKLLEE
jgi:hypothetical protein